MRGRGSYTRHRHDFGLAASEGKAREEVDTKLLRARVMWLYHMGLSYRQIAGEVGLHFTRVGQIVRESKE